MRRVTAAAIVGAAMLLAAGCSSSSAGTTSSGTGSGNTDPAPVTVRLGFLENITHASALVALKEGFFTKDLGSAGTLKPTAFSTGTGTCGGRGPPGIGPKYRSAAAKT